MATSHFRVSNSLDHLRTEVKGNNCSSSNADLLILRKLIQEENCSLDQENLDHTGSGYFRAPTVPDRFSVNRIGAPGHWAAEARRHTFRESQPSVEEVNCPFCAFVRSLCLTLMLAAVWIPRRSPADAIAGRSSRRSRR